MNNPWKDISLSDYESHMSLDSVYQLQTMNRAMKDQFERFPVDSVMVFGIAGGNGLEHIDPEKFDRVYGIDINPLYLEAIGKRYESLSGRLECLCLDLTSESDRLPHAELVIANLLIEYIGCDAFREAVAASAPVYVSCMIQINEDTGESWVASI
ncbi:MAG: methyltransferase type 11 [Oscillospiraceae bacterium]|nr:methyltransferase type 11 [Oscillospiraceae bacterium]